MDKGKSKTVIIIVGMPGAGKSLASQVAKRMKIPVFVSGDVIRNEALRRGLSPNKKNLGQVMLHIRKTDGMGAVARRLVPLIELSAGMTLVYEGARSMEEVGELARHYNVSIIAIHASPETRFRRLLKRKRGDRPRMRPCRHRQDRVRAACVAPDREPRPAARWSARSLDRGCGSPAAPRHRSSREYRDRGR